MATLRELAEITGYSIATISRVLNGDSTLKVTESTRTTILEAAGRMSYAGRQSVHKKCAPGEHRKIGIVEMAGARELEKNPYYLYLKGSVEKSCFSNELETFILQYDEKRGSYHCAVPKELDGIIAIGQFQTEKIEAMKKCSPQIVFIDASPFPREFCSVLPDYELGIRLGMDYLIHQGHRKIMFVGPEFTTDAVCRPSPEIRRRIFLDYAASCGTDVEAFLLDTAEAQTEKVMEEVTAYINGLKESDSRPTAFITFNDPTAIGVLQGLQRMGYQAPEDFSILSYNDTALATIMKPQISSICLNIEAMAENAVWLIRRLIEEDYMVPLKISISPSLQIGESVKNISR